MIVFAHTKFGLVRIQGSEVKRGGGIGPPPVWASFSNPGPDRVKGRRLVEDGVYFTFPFPNAAFIGGRRLKEEIEPSSLYLLSSNGCNRISYKDSWYRKVASEISVVLPVSSPLIVTMLTCV